MLLNESDNDLEIAVRAMPPLIHRATEVSPAEGIAM